MEKYQKNFKNVTIIAPENTFIERGAKIGVGTVIYPGNYIKNGVKIGKNSVIYPNNFIENCVIGDRCSVGPCAHIRENTTIANNVKIGNFCEIKASFVGDNCKISHLSYIGDAFLKNNINVGCGVTTANFDGIKKYKTNIAENSFIGCNTTIVAPVDIGKNCYVGAGSVVTCDIPNNTFAISRAELKTKQNRGIIDE